MTYAGLTDSLAMRLEDGTLRLEWPVGPAGKLRAEIPRAGAVLIRATTDVGDYVERYCERHLGVIAATAEDYLRLLGMAPESGADRLCKAIAAEVLEACD